MNTRKSIASVSYNSVSFLKSKLDELVRLGHVSYWFFICHKAESDETKDHIHLYLEPAHQIKTDDLCQFLIEIVPGQDRPLKTMPFMSSHFVDWYLYVLHDVSYLDSKGLSRIYHYSRDDFICSDRDILDYLVLEVCDLEVSGMDRILAAVRGGQSFREMVMRGQVPIEQFRNYENVYHYLAGDDSEMKIIRSLLDQLHKLDLDE